MADPWAVVAEAPVQQQAASNPWAVVSEAPHEVPSRPIRNDLMSGTTGLGELALQMGTGTLGLGAAGVSNIVDAIKGKDARQIRDSGNAIQDALTYRPRTPEGKAYSEAVALPFKGFQLMGEAATDALNEKGAPRGVSAGVGSTIDLIPQVAAALLGQRANSGNAGMPIPMRSIPRGDPAKIPLVDALLPGGIKKASGRILRDVAGTPADRQVLVDAIKNRRQIVPGSEPTTAETVAELPQGIGVAALEQEIKRQTGNKSGNPATRFDERAKAQEAARQALAEARDTVTGPMRESALAGANSTKLPYDPLSQLTRDFQAMQPTARTGVPIAGLVKGIDEIKAPPGIRASEVVQKSLGHLKDRIKELAPDGYINAKDLYTIRKESGNVIETFSKETANWDKKLTGGLQSSIQKGIDDAIEQAGGKGWKEYLDTYATISQSIEADAARAATAKQRATLGQVPTNDAPAGAVSGIPGMLNSKVMVANAILRHAGKKVSPKVVEQLTQDLLDPDKFAEQIKVLPPKQRAALASEITKRYGAGAAAGIALSEPARTGSN